MSTIALASGYFPDSKQKFPDTQKRCKTDVTVKCTEQGTFRILKDARERKYPESARIPKREKMGCCTSSANNEANNTNLDPPPKGSSNGGKGTAKEVTPKEKEAVTDMVHQVLEKAEKRIKSEEGASET